MRRSKAVKFQDIHDKKTGNNLYCIIKKEQMKNGKKWVMEKKLFTKKDILKNDRFKMVPFPTPSIFRLDKFKIIKDWMKTKKINNLFKKTAWTKINIYFKPNNTRRETLSITKTKRRKKKM